MFQKPILTKLMNINLYAQLLVDNYNGVLLPQEINASNYSNVMYIFVQKVIFLNKYNSKYPIDTEAPTQSFDK